jgi:hypothetical protein
VVEFLASKGADMTKKNARGFTAQAYIDESTKEGRLMAKLLQGSFTYSFDFTFRIVCFSHFKTLSGRDNSKKREKKELGVCCTAIESFSLVLTARSVRGQIASIDGSTTHAYL